MTFKSPIFPNTYTGIKFKSINEAADEALQQIDAERQDEQLGLYCSWSRVNRGMGKYWRFNHITQIAGPSGHGKSYTINQLHDDFTDLVDVLNSDGSMFKEGINREFKKEVVVIHFGLEMDASDEVLRNLCRKIGKSHNWLLSSEHDPANDDYNRISDKDFKIIQNRMHYLRSRPIYYVEMTGTTMEMYKTVEYVRLLHPNAQLVISIDHTLLVQRSDGQYGDGDLIAAVARLALRFRKEFKAMVILLGQLNQNIKSAERLNSPHLQYPLDSDIYFGAQVNWVCDNIWIFPYRPELNNLQTYGIKKLPTKDLVIASCVKSRKGRIGEVLLQAELNKGRFIERVTE